MVMSFLVLCKIIYFQLKIKINLISIYWYSFQFPAFPAAPYLNWSQKIWSMFQITKPTVYNSVPDINNIFECSIVLQKWRNPYVSL